MTDRSHEGSGLCESESADICLMTKILYFFPPSEHFVGNLFVLLVEATRLVMLVKLWYKFFGPELFNSGVGYVLVGLFLFYQRFGLLPR